MRDSSRGKGCKPHPSAIDGRGKETHHLAIAALLVNHPLSLYMMIAPTVSIPYHVGLTLYRNAVRRSTRCRSCASLVEVFELAL